MKYQKKSLPLQVKIPLPSDLEEILIYLLSKSAKVFLVGGCVRDYLLGIKNLDYDIEVFNISEIELEKYLKKFGSLRLLGKNFGVYKLSIKVSNKVKTYDFSLPRTETKIAKGHKGFKVITHKNLKLEQASSRRDFTINALMYDYEKQQILDFFGGLKDLENKNLAFVNAKSFCEDALRIYRGIGFCARFSFHLSKETKTLCKSIKDDLCALPKERIFEEFKKFLLKAPKPALAFDLMDELLLLDFFPPLKALNENKKAWEEMKITINNLANLNEDDGDKLYFILAGTCLFFSDEKLINQKISKDFLILLTNDKKLLNKVLALVKFYEKLDFFGNLSDKDIKILAKKINIKKLCKFLENIFLKDNKKLLDFLNRAKTLGVQNYPRKAVVNGKDLLALGFKPSKDFKKILDFAYDLQISKTEEKNILLEFVKKEFAK